MKINNEKIWTSRIAYAVGLFTADGHLSKDGRHLVFTSKDEEQVINFANCLGLDGPIALKSRSGLKRKFDIANTIKREIDLQNA